MGHEEQPISRERFKNNADRLVFPDRHEYRTHSRAEYFFYGLVYLATALGGIIFSVRWRMLNTPLMAIVVIVAIWAPAVILLWAAVYCFGFRPRVVIRPTGIELRNWPPEFLRIRRKNLRVEIADITGMDIRTKGVAGDRGNRALYYQHTVRLSLLNQEDLILPWRAIDKDEAQRFLATVAHSIQEMVNRTQPVPFR